MRCAHAGKSCDEGKLSHGKLAHVLLGVLVSILRKFFLLIELRSHTFMAVTRAWQLADTTARFFLVRERGRLCGGNCGRGFVSLI